MNPVQTQKLKREQTEAEMEYEPQCRDRYVLRDQFDQQSTVTQPKRQ